MKQTILAHENCPAFHHALDLLVAVREVADTDDRSTNERLKLLARSLLEHTASLGVGRTRPSRAMRVEYARIALAKLAATLDAARSLRLISDCERAEIRDRLIVLEGLLENQDRHGGPPREAVQDRDEDASESNERPARSPSADELSELIRLVGPETWPSDPYDAPTYFVGPPTQVVRRLRRLRSFLAAPWSVA